MCIRDRYQRRVHGRVHLDLSQNEIQHEGAMKICDYIEKLAQKVEHIKFYFLNTAINNSTKAIMEQRLSHYKNLEFVVNVILSKEYAEKQALDQMRKEGAIIFNDTKSTEQEQQARVQTEPENRPKAEEPKTEQPKTEQPKVEQPKIEQPKIEQPKTEQPKTEDQTSKQKKRKQHN
eukprot:TRINITY_DN4111_c0_g1_i1.p2 TRINITY_DN4111_c0_g1~~TRINITY_DN4111_c0_g1_i1.p2  ORF type:complete len:176 (+),score=50.53 TRINITY_DN4111_c0_g1_i1:76-603(+)